MSVLFQMAGAMGINPSQLRAEVEAEVEQ